MLLGVSILVLALLLYWFALRATSQVAAPISVGFTSWQKGHIGDFYSDHFTVAMVTNATPRQIGLDSPWVECEQNGIVVTYLSNLWGGTNNFCSLASGAVMPLPVGVPTNSPRFRICFHYNQPAGILQRAAVPLVRAFTSRFTTPFLRWVCNSGFADGRLHRNYQGIWQTRRKDKQYENE